MEDINTQNESGPGLNAKLAWILPLACWLFTAVTNLLHINKGVSMNYFLGLVELVLFVILAYIGIQVLLNRQSLYSKEDKKHAIIGLTIIGLTLGMILVLIIMTLMVSK
jgi:hypothetical protein